MRKRDAAFYRRKAAMADLIERAGGQRRAGELVGLSQQLMSRVNLRDDPTMLSGDAKLALEIEAGEPLLTRIEAELLGFRLEPLAAPTSHADGTPFDAHAAVMAEVGDVCSTFAACVRDGHYSRADAGLVGKALRELRREIERFERVNAATEAAGPS